MTKNDAINLMEYAVILGRREGAASAWAVAKTVQAAARLGREAHSWAERLCNYGEPTEGADDRKRASIRERTASAFMALGLTNLTIEVEGDPRGSCLKVSAPGLSTLRF